MQMIPSLEAAAKQCERSRMHKAVTLALSSAEGRKVCREALVTFFSMRSESHTFTVPSLLPDAKNTKSGDTARQVMAATCSVR